MNKKAVIDLEEVIKDRIYRELADKTWQKVEKFREEIMMDMDKLAVKHSKRLTKEILKEIEIIQKQS